VAKCDHLKSLKYRPTMPYAFTEQGIGQLSSVVHSKKAIETSIKIMNAFVAMRRFMVQNLNILMLFFQRLVGSIAPTFKIYG
ncbi:MAG: ORF6N domain-containing protein, partial [Bacteroidales bacterium]|nr:ORF6N domain-containing protein [Bacteroidales bacterium]